MQAAAQGLVDTSISKTVNCPEEIEFEAFAEVYREGYRLGCKGLTTYRPNAITGSVLSVTPAARPRKRRRPRPPPRPWSRAPSCCRARPTRSNGPRAPTPSM